MLTRCAGQVNSLSTVLRVDAYRGWSGGARNAGRARRTLASGRIRKGWSFADTIRKADDASAPGGSQLGSVGCLEAPDQGSGNECAAR